MNELSGLLCVLLFVATVVTVFGYGMWVLLSNIFGFLFGNDKPDNKRPCGNCGRMTSEDTPRCDWCGVARDDHTRAAAQDHHAFLRQLKRLRKAGLIDEKTADEIALRATVYCQQLQKPKQQSPAKDVCINAEIVDEARPQEPTPQPAPPKPQPTFRGDSLPTPLPVDKPKPRPQPAPLRPSREKGPLPVGPFQKPTPPPTVAPTPVPIPAPPRRSFGQMLEAFMEERNMRWGELIGGLLIVGGGSALAISLRNMVSIPYSQFLIFATIAAVVLGMGLYAHHRWRLATTSRGMLMIGVLLTPLSFLIMAHLSKEHGQLLTLGVETVSLAVFGFLLWPTMKVLVPKGRAWGTAGVLVQSAVMLVLTRLNLTELGQSGRQIWLTVAAGLVPAIIFAVVVLGFTWQYGSGLGSTASARRRGQLDAADAVGLFSLLGTAAFALVLAHGLLVVQGAKGLGMSLMLECLSPSVALAALGLLTVGLTISRGLVAASDLLKKGATAGLSSSESDKNSSTNEALEAYRMAGTAVALVGLATLLAAMGLAWPAPLAMIAVGLLATAALVWSAFRYRMPALHAGAIASISLVALVGYQTAVGHLLSLSRDELPAEMLRLVTSASSANVLAAVFVAMAIVAELLVRSSQRRHGVVYLGGCAVLAVLGLSLVTWHGFADGLGFADTADGYDVLRAAILFGLYASVCMGLAARWRNTMFADAGVWLTAGSMLWAAWWADLPLAGALLLHASVAALALLAIRIMSAGKEDDIKGATGCLSASVLGRFSAALADKQPVAPLSKHAAKIPIVFSSALLLGAFCSSILAVPTLLLQTPQTTLAAAGFVCWIAAVWMLIGVLVQRSSVVAAAQAALSLAAVLASTAWIESQGLLLGNPISLQAYCFPLAVLGLVWAGVRIATRQMPAANKLLNPSWLPVDTVVQYAVVCCQFAAAVWWLVIACGGEFFGSTRIATISPARILGSCGLGAWLVLAVLAAWAVVSLWSRWRDTELAAAIIIALTVPCLLATTLVGDLASASAARWSMAACFAVCSLPVWYRRDMARLLTHAGAKLELSPNADRLARGMIVTAAAGTAVALTVFAAVFELSGNRAMGPTAGTFFDSLGSQVSYLVPLATVILVLVGYAIRERSSAYAFCAGLVVELTVILGYALSVTLAGTPDSPRFEITLLQLATTTAAVWAGLWLAARRWAAFWREDTNTTSAKILMNIQLAMAMLGNLLLLLPALGMLSVASFWFDKWIGLVGSPLGWAAFLLTVAVAVWHNIERQRSGVLANFIGIVGLAAVGLLACSVQQYCVAYDISGNWAYRTLMIGWAMYSLTVVLSTWWASVLLSEDEADGPPLILVRAASVWVGVSGILAAGLGLKAAFIHGDQLWAAMAIAVPSLAGAVMAVWQRREWWAFTSAMGVNLAASLVVWHVKLHTPFEDWWVMLVQANVIASALVALVWLAARSSLKRLRDLADGVGPLLSTQIFMAAAGNCLLLALPVGHLVLQPQSLPYWMTQLSGPAGWTALLLTVAAAAWLQGRLQMRHLLHVFCSLAVGTVILAACGLPAMLVKIATMASGGPNTAWMAFHILVGGWTAIVLLVTGLGIAGQKIRIRGQKIFAPDAVCSWALVVGSAAFVFTLLWCLADPNSPWWPGGIVLSLSLAAGAVGIWRRMPAVVYASGVLVNVAGTIAWAKWMPHRAETFLEVNALCLAATTVLWSLVDMFTKQRPSVARSANLQWPYAQVAIRVALSMMAALAAILVYQNVLGINHPPLDRLTWISLASVAAALMVLAWDRSSWVTLSGMYVLGLVTISLGLVQAELKLTDMIWLATVELSGFALTAAFAGWALPGLWPLWQRMGIRRESRGILPEWFTVSQLLVVSTVAVSAAWIAIDYKFQSASHPALAWMGGRLFAPVAVLALVGGAILMAQQMKQHWRESWQYVAMATTALLFACLGWALLPVDQAAIWLHRSAVLMIACTATTLLAAGGLRLILPKSSDWIPAAMRIAAPLAGLAFASLAIVLTLEFKLFEQPHGPPTELWAELSVAAALVALCGGCICLAVIPKLEPFGLSQRGRTLYVYAAEAMILLLCLHVRLTMPELFGHGFFRRYWMLIVMAVSFAGAGLSEMFQRMRQPVLSEPLANTALVAPLLPAVGFWFMASPSPAMWFLMGLFYGTMAAMKRSFALGSLAILTANIGLWVLWQRMGLEFFEHPQIWLIPGALAVLVAGHLHRDRLSEAQNVGLRWAALGVIYVSSTADMFIAGIGHSIALPLVLAVLSVAGVLAGILFRIRSFLYLGTTFLGLVIVTMIKYAAWDCQQMWILWSCCILLGAGVIALFAVFEKRRNDVLAAVERLKEWKA